MGTKLRENKFINTTGFLFPFSVQASWPVVLGQLAGLAGWPLQLSASKYMNVQMIHRLCAHLAIINHWKQSLRLGIRVMGEVKTRKDHIKSKGFMDKSHSPSRYPSFRPSACAIFLATRSKCPRS